MKGFIIINPFRIPAESVRQAERLKQEFNNLGVTAQIVSDGYLRVSINGQGVDSDFSQADFIVYLDKDKYLSETLEKRGYRLFNKHTSIRVCDDKARTYISLAGKGFNLPKTIFGALCYNNDCSLSQTTVSSIGERLGYPLIVKECYGSMGKGIYKADNKAQLAEIMEKVKTRPHLFQEYIDFKRGVDVRIIVIGGKAFAHMERCNSDDFRSNVARGGTGRVVDVSQEFIVTAEKISKELDLDYCGVDLLYGQNGEPIVCEVNSNAFFEGIEKATGKNVAKAYAEYIVNTVKK